MARSRNSVTMDARGRVILPRAVRDHLNLSPGDLVLFRVLGNGSVVMESRDQVMARVLWGAPAFPDAETTTETETEEP